MSDVSNEKSTMEELENIAATADSLVEENLDELSSDTAAEDLDGDEEIEIRQCSLPLKSQVEAVLFASDRPMKTVDVQEIIGDQHSAKHVNECIHEIVAEFEQRESGFKLAYLKSHGYQFQTVPEAGPLMERQFSSRPRPLSRAAQETLAIVAYRQPVTRAEVEFIRGVDAGSIMKGLLERGFVKVTGRKEVPGRPMLFATTDEFLKVFGIDALEELPPLEAFQPEQKMVEDAMEAIEAGMAVDEAVGDALEKQKPGLMEDAQKSADNLDVDGIEESVELSPEVEEMKKNAEKADRKIKEILDDGDAASVRKVKGASSANKTELDDQFNDSTEVADSEVSESDGC